MNKGLFFFIFFLFAFGLLFSFLFYLPQKGLLVDFCDVGQGDATFIQSPSGFQVLIDGGPDEKVLSCLSSVMPPWDKSIDLVVLSHPHADHLRGLLEVLKRYQVGQILSTDAVHTSPEFFNWLSLIKEKKIPFETSQKVKGVDLKGGWIEVLFPKESFQDKRVKNLNNTSVVLRLEYQGVGFLFPGDLEEEGQKKLLKEKTEIRPVVFLKVPHHGSKTALSDAFLEKIQPKVAIISVGQNRYGHPAAQTIEKLKKEKVVVKRTDLDGTIEVEVDPKGIWKMRTK